MKQIALDIGLSHQATLNGFLAGPNQAALQHLSTWSGGATRSPVPTYLWGPAGVGKSHLLRAVRHALLAQGAAVGWLDAEGEPGAAFSEQWDAILMDDVHLYNAEQQHTAFNWFINAVSPASGRPRGVLAAGLLPPSDLPLRDDLRTRLGWGHVFELHLLQEQECRAVLRQAADARGVFLSDEVMTFVLARFSRDLGSLMQLLEHLDRYALQTKRAITIPLVKSMLENE
ncbi:DnaA regulatory inactivator Hda [Ottowia sp. VDI28]|uniref:DnaA regulatory inactivator Hda n=1 Tax=Ottowia sp. VDI28 TaxID=3133968 RepID=UPI003C2BDE4F